MTQVHHATVGRIVRRCFRHGSSGSRSPSLAALPEVKMGPHSGRNSAGAQLREAPQARHKIRRVGRPASPRPAGKVVQPVPEAGRPGQTGAPAPPAKPRSATAPPATSASRSVPTASAGRSVCARAEKAERAGPNRSRAGLPVRGTRSTSPQPATRTAARSSGCPRSSTSRHAPPGQEPTQTPGSAPSTAANGNRPAPSLTAAWSACSTRDGGCGAWNSAGIARSTRLAAFRDCCRPRVTPTAIRWPIRFAGSGAYLYRQRDSDRFEEGGVSKKGTL